MQLHDVHQGIHKRKKRKRIGRGIGSGHGKTAGKGHKGHSSRQGFKINNARRKGARCPWSAGSPSVGSPTAPSARTTPSSTCRSLEACYPAGATVDEAALRARGLVKGRHDDGVKILGDGALTKPLTVHAAKFSASAAAKIAAAGGQAVAV